MARPPSAWWSRRRVLRATGGAVTAGLAGCLTLTGRSDPCPNKGSLSFDEATPAHISNEFSTPVDGLGYATRSAVEDALDGDATDRGYYSPEPHTAYVVTGSGPRYYRVETTDHDRSTATGYDYAVDIGVDESSHSVYAFADLPVRDRESLRAAIGNPHLIDAPHYDSFVVTFAYEQADVRDRSVFVPDRGTQYLEWRNSLLRLTPTGRQTVTITTTTVSTELVAGSSGEFTEYLGSERGVVLDGLTDRQRVIVKQAIDGTYTECETHSEAFSDLRERLSVDSDRPALLARYDGQWYFTGLGATR